MKKLAYYIEKFNLERAPKFSQPTEEFSVLSAGDVLIEGVRMRGSGDVQFLIVHGLTANMRSPGIRQFTEAFTSFGDVWAIDLRGHGMSGGSCTLGVMEADDIAAATRHILDATGRPPIVVGLSMGGAAAVRAAALLEPVAGVVSIGGPARWDGPRGPGAKRMKRLWQIPGGTTFIHLLTGVRIEPTFAECEEPAAVAHKISPAPLLVVHGEQDEFFPAQEAVDLYESALDPKELWLVPGGGHAEGMFMVPGKPVDVALVQAFAQEIWRRMETLLSEDANG